MFDVELTKGTLATKKCSSGFIKRYHIEYEVNLHVYDTNVSIFMLSEPQPAKF